MHGAHAVAASRVEASSPFPNLAHTKEPPCRIKTFQDPSLPCWIGSPTSQCVRSSRSNRNGLPQLGDSDGCQCCQAKQQIRIHKARCVAASRAGSGRKKLCQQWLPFMTQAMHCISAISAFDSIRMAWHLPSGYVCVTREDKSVGKSACQASASMPTGMQPSMVPAMPSGQGGCGILKRAHSSFESDTGTAPQPGFGQQWKPSSPEPSLATPVRSRPANVRYTRTPNSPEHYNKSAVLDGCPRAS